MGVMLQRDNQNQRLYIHDVLIEKEVSSSSEDHLSTTGPAKENRNLFLTNILQKVLDVKQQFSLSDQNDTSSVGGGIYGKDIALETAPVRESPTNGTATPAANESVGAATVGFDANTHLQYQYGTLPEGHNAVRPDDLPASTDGVNRVSQTAVTVKGAKVTSDEFSDLLTKDVTENNGMTYISITNDATVQKAMEHIAREGWEAARGAWQADVHAGKTGADMAAVGCCILA